ncbi:hypothetical protein CL620_05570 [archaeon]|nr:hypothetical protein [archaeon]
MKKLITWELCERKFIRNVEPDMAQVDSLVEKALLRYKRANNTKADNETISFIVEDYYEVIKELLVAYLLTKGMRSQNHQCLIAFLLKEHPEYEHEITLISQMSYFRNRLNYYGETVPAKFYHKNKDEFHSVIKLLQTLFP